MNSSHDEHLLDLTPDQTNIADTTDAANETAATISATGAIPIDEPAEEDLPE